MIVWSGWGILAVAGFMIGGVLAAILTEGQGIDDTGFFFAVTAFTAAAVTFAANEWVRRRPQKVVVDAATGAETVQARSHSLFFIPIRYWPILYYAVGALAVGSALKNSL